MCIMAQTASLWPLRILVVGFRVASKDRWSTYLDPYGTKSLASGLESKHSVSLSKQRTKKQPGNLGSTADFGPRPHATATTPASLRFRERRTRTRRGTSVCLQGRQSAVWRGSWALDALGLIAEF